MSKYTDWLRTLDGRQVRALAAQTGIKSWRTRQIGKLVEILERSSKGQNVWRLNYGRTERPVERSN